MSTYQYTTTHKKSEWLAKRLQEEEDNAPMENEKEPSLRICTEGEEDNPQLKVLSESTSEQSIETGDTEVSFWRSYWENILKPFLIPPPQDPDKDFF